MFEDLWWDVTIVLVALLPVLGFLESMRDRIRWLRDSENVKIMIQRLPRATLATLLYLAALCLFLRLVWWIFSQPVGSG